MKTTCLFAAKATRVLSICFLSLLIGGATIARAQDRQAGLYFTTIVPHGELKQGAVIRLGKNRFRGQAEYTLISGEGPARGWVEFHALRLGENQ